MKRSGKKMGTATKLVLLGAAGAASYYYFFRKTLKGDFAKVGDLVLVPTATLAAGALPAAIPQGVGYIGILVTAISGSTIQGKLTAYILQENPLIAQSLTVNPPVQVQKNQVTSVYRSTPGAATPALVA